MMVHAGSRYAVDSLIAARQSGARPVRLRPEPAPAPFDEAYRWQDALLAELGPVAGWKVGSDSPASEPFRAGLTASTLHQSPARLDGSRHNVIGVEAEIVYMLAHSLP